MSKKKISTTQREARSSPPFGSARGGHSGLSVSTLRKYGRSMMLEFGEGDEFPLYLHSMRCPNYCEYACNGNHGFAIADDIRELQLYKSPNAEVSEVAVADSTKTSGVRPPLSLD